jgi:hypothetical protein
MFCVAAFANKKARVDGVGLSVLAQDTKDWSRYYVNRCVNSRYCVMYTFTGFGTADLLIATS